MAALTTTELKKIEKALLKLRNKIKRADLDYTVQISINSTDPGTVTYAAQLTSPARGLAPVTFIKSSAEELIADIKAATKELNYDEIEKAYHEAQIEACKRTIEGHEERIKAIAEGDTVVENLERIDEEEAAQTEPNVTEPVEETTTKE